MNYWGCEEGTRRKYYGSDDDEFGVMMFIPRCLFCGRFVKPDDMVKINGLGELSQEPNATCKTHGRVCMPFEGYA